MAKESEIYVAKESGSVRIKKTGEEVVFVKGVTRVREGHPILKQVPEYFAPVDEHVHYEIERATRAPGEKKPVVLTEPEPTVEPEPTPEPEPAPAKPEGLTLSSLKGQ